MNDTREANNIRYSKISILNQKNKPMNRIAQFSDDLLLFYTENKRFYFISFIDEMPWTIQRKRTEIQMRIPALFSKKEAIKD